jgi:hypothetical protein
MRFNSTLFWFETVIDSTNHGVLADEFFGCATIEISRHNKMITGKIFFMSLIFDVNNYQRSFSIRPVLVL